MCRYALARDFAAFMTPHAQRRPVAAFVHKHCGGTGRTRAAFVQALVGIQLTHRLQPFYLSSETVLPIKWNRSTYQTALPCKRNMCRYTLALRFPVHSMGECHPNRETPWAELPPRWGAVQQLHSVDP